MIYPFGTAVTIVHAGVVDPYGDSVAGTSETIDGCAVAPRSSSDIDGRGRAGVIVGLTVLFPADTVIAATDRFEIDGVLYQIEGVPGVWVSPFTGWRPGVEVALTRGAG